MNPGILTTYFLLSAATATLLFTLSGCETSVELDTPPFEKDLVIYAHLEANSSPNAYVYISHTRSPGSNEVFIPIENAEFKLSKDGMPAEDVTANIVYPQPGNYSLYEVKTGLIQPGSTYTIEVTSGGNYPNITATTLIPHIQPDISFEHFNTPSNDQDTYQILLNDNPSADYYQLFLEAYDTTTTSRQVIQFSVDAQSEVNDFPVNDAANYPLKGGYLFDDKGYNGQEKEIFINIPKGQLDLNDINRGTWKYELHVSKVSESFYLFNKTVAQQNGTFPIPIFGNSATPYTNVQNGYGCFSAQYISIDVSNKFISE